MSDPYMSQIVMMANTFAPMFFASANGASVSIVQNSALYSLLGTTYGGDGTSNFLLPDLCGRTAIGMGLSQRDRIYNYTQGQYAGADSLQLTASQMPTHTHTATFTPTGSSNLSVSITVSTASGGVNTASGNYLASSPTNSKIYATSGTAGSTLNGVTISGATSGGTVANDIAGGGARFSIMPPYVVMNYLIATQGVYTVRQ